jgi:uncharacterized membrane protein YccC
MSYFSIRSKEISFALRIFIGCVIVWLSLDYFHDAKKIWAIISVITVSDPNFNAVRENAKSRLLNTLMGCIVGLLFIYLFGIGFWQLMVAVTISVLISTSFKKYPSTWKLAPVTVVILMIPPLQGSETIKDAMSIALNRTGEVLYGSLVAFLLGLLYLKIETMSEKKFMMRIKVVGKEGDKGGHE